MDNLGKRFTVVVALHKEFPPCASVSLTTKSVKVDWLEEEEGARLLTLHFTNGKKHLPDLSQNNQQAMRKLAVRCDGIPYVLQAVGLAGQDESIPLENKIARFLGDLSSNYTLFQQFCSRFDAGLQDLKQCFSRRWKLLPENLKTALLSLSAISGSFSEAFAFKGVLQRSDTVSVLNLLRSWGLLTQDSDQRYKIPRYFRQYLLTLDDCDSIEQNDGQSSEATLNCVEDAKRRYFEHLQKVVKRLSKNRSRERLGSEKFKGIRNYKRLLDFFHTPADILLGKSYSFALFICQSEEARRALLDLISIDVLRKFCKNCLKSAQCSEKPNESFCFSVFFAQVLLKQERFERGDLARVEKYLQSIVSEEVLPKNVIQQWRTSRAEFLMAKGLYKKAVSLLEKAIEETFSSQLILGKAHYRLGVKACARFDLATDLGNAVRTHFETAKTCFMSCLERLGKDDCLRCFILMWIADTYFRMGDYDSATESYEKLLKEEEKVYWPGEETQEKLNGRKKTRSSALHYALGLSRVLQLYVKARQWIRTNLGSCISSLTKSKLTLGDSHLSDDYLSDCIHLANGKALLLLALQEKHSLGLPAQKVVNLLNSAEESFNEISLSLLEEKTAFLAITRACLKEESTVMTQLGDTFPESAKLFLTRSGDIGYYPTPTALFLKLYQILTLIILINQLQVFFLAILSCILI